MANLQPLDDFVKRLINVRLQQVVQSAQDLQFREK
jgi:hypothetical protein